MHPEDEAGAVGGAVGLEAEGADFLGAGEDGLEDDGVGEFPGGVQFLDDALGVGGDLLEGLGAVEMLAAGDVPDFGGGRWGHGEWELTAEAEEGKK